MAALTTSSWFSILSSLVGLAGLVLASVVAIQNRGLATAQIKTDLLTKLFGARVDYARFNRRITELRKKPPDPLPPELKILLDDEAVFLKFEQDTEKYRQALLGPKRNLGSRKLLALRHHVDAMVKQIEDDNKRLDEILGRVSRPS